VSFHVAECRRRKHPSRELRAQSEFQAEGYDLTHEFFCRRQFAQAHGSYGGVTGAFSQW